MSIQQIETDLMDAKMRKDYTEIYRLNNLLFIAKRGVKS